MSFQEKNLTEISVANDLYRKILGEQEKGALTSRKYGLWPSDIVVPQNPIQLLGCDYNILAGLQISLMLLDISAKVFLPELQQIQSRFDIALSSFILDAEKSGRPSGYIAFWPLMQYSSIEWRHNFDPDNVSFRHMDIKSDSGDSALAALYLMKTAQHIDHVSEYAKRLSSKDFENGFYTFLPAMNYSGGIDLIDNIHILSAIQMLKKNYPNFVTNQLIKNEENAILRTRKILEFGLIKNNLLYYRRVSQFLFAFTKQKHDQLSPFNENDCSTVEAILEQELKQQNFSQDNEFSEQLELLLASEFFKRSESCIQNSQKKRLFEKIETILLKPYDSMSKISIGEYTSFIAGSGFVNTGIYNKFVGWYAPSHTAALTLLYLTYSEHI